MINIFTLVGRITRDLELRYRRLFETYKKKKRRNGTLFVSSEIKVLMIITA